MSTIKKFEDLEVWQLEPVTNCHGLKMLASDRKYFKYADKMRNK